MNLQADHQRIAIAPAHSAGIESVLPTEADISAERESSRESAGSRREGKPGERTANRNLPGKGMKLNTKRGSRMKSAPIEPLSPRKQARARKDNFRGPAPVADPSAANACLEETLREICDVLCAQSGPPETDGAIREPRLSEREIPAKSMPAQDSSAISNLNEPDWSAAEAIAFRTNHPPKMGPALPRIEKKGLLTVTLRIRNSPLAAVLQSLDSLLTQGWSWMQQKLRAPRGKKRLRVCESVSLGEKRFVAVIQVDGEQFLVGGSSSSVSTLAHLERSREFSDVFERHCAQDLSPA